MVGGGGGEESWFLLLTSMLFCANTYPPPREQLVPSDMPLMLMFDVTASKSLCFPHKGHFYSLPWP